MSAAELDRALRDLRRSTDALTSDLLALEADPTYQLLRAAASSLRGRTAATVIPALEGLAGAWQRFPTLAGLVDRAESLREQGGRAHELQELVQIAAPPLVAEVSAALTRARAAVADVGRAWESLVPGVDRAKADIGALQARGSMVGLQPPPLKRAEAAIERLSAEVADDPLGAQGGLADDVPALLRAAETELVAIEQERRSVVEGLPAARRRLAGLVQLIERGRVALAEARADVLDAAGLLTPLDADLLDGSDRGLTPWLDRLDELGAACEWHLAARGLLEWNHLAASIEEAATRVVGANERPVARRHELRGLLRAAKVKAAAAGLAEDEEADRSFEAADAQLRSRPCDLAAAELAVQRYLATVRRRSGEDPS